jgi:hypothetical protein
MILTAGSRVSQYRRRKEWKMRLRTLLWTTCISAALAVAAPATAATVPQQCVAGEPTAASQTWDFKGEANNIFKDIQSDAQQAATDADYLQSLDQDYQVSWDSHAVERSRSNRRRGSVNGESYPGRDRLRWLPSFGPLAGNLQE